MNPDLELGRFLTEQTSFRHSAPVAGALEYRSHTGAARTVGILHGFVPHRGDAWRGDPGGARRVLCGGPGPAARGVRRGAPQSVLALAAGDIPPRAEALIGPYVASARLLGQRTAALHRALASAPETRASPRSRGRRRTSTRSHSPCGI